MTLDEARALPPGSRVFVCMLIVDEGYVSATEGRSPYALQSHSVLVRIAVSPLFRDRYGTGRKTRIWKRLRRRRAVHHTDLFLTEQEAQDEWNRRRVVNVLATGGP